MASASSRSTAIGFSTKTWHPASMARMDRAACVWGGVTMCTTSGRWRSSITSSDRKGLGMEKRAAVLLARSSSVSASAMTSAPGYERTYGMCTVAIWPPPTIPTFTGLSSDRVGSDGYGCSPGAIILPRRAVALVLTAGDVRPLTALPNVWLPYATRKGAHARAAEVAWRDGCRAPPSSSSRAGTLGTDLAVHHVRLRLGARNIGERLKLRRHAFRAPGARPCQLQHFGE